MTHETGAEALAALLRRGENSEQDALRTLAPLTVDELRRVESAADMLSTLCGQVLTSKGSRPSDIGDEPVCDHTHTGTWVSWPPEATGDEYSSPRIAIQVCPRAQCQADAAAWVYRATGHHGEFVPFHR